MCARALVACALLRRACALVMRSAGLVASGAGAHGVFAGRCRLPQAYELPYPSRHALRHFLVIRAASASCSACLRGCEARRLLRIRCGLNGAGRGSFCTPRRVVGVCALAPAAGALLCWVLGGLTWLSTGAAQRGSVQLWVEGDSSHARSIG